MKASHKIATSPDVLIAKGKISVATATVLVAISSPVEFGVICPTKIVTLYMEYVHNYGYKFFVLRTH